MEKLWLLLISLLAFPAFADTEQSPGQTAKANVVFPVRYPAVDTTKPGWGSFALGPNALTQEYLPSGYQNFAIGYGALNGALTTAGIQNFAIGNNACGKITSGMQNTCIGANAGKNITTAVDIIAIGTGAGSGITTTALSNYVTIIDASNPASPCTTCSASVLIGNGTGVVNGSDNTIIGYNAAAADTNGGTLQTVIGANVASIKLGSTGTQNTVLLIGGDNTLDVATTSTNTVIGIGSGKPGSFDTSIGYGALATNAQDSAFQTAFGYHSLNLSNVANAQNSAFGYNACGAVTTGKNNVCFGYNAGGTTLATGSNNILIGSGADTLTSSTSNEINIGGLLFYTTVSTAAPAVSACGTGSPAIDSKANNKSGTVTAGTVATTCTITFAGGGYTTYNHCRVSVQNEGTSNAAYSYTTTAITVTAGTLGGALIDYDCDGV